MRLLGWALGAALVSMAPGVAAEGGGVSVSMAAGHARMRIERSVSDGWLTERLPPGGVVVGFRVRPEGGRWRGGALLDVAAAAARWRGKGEAGGFAALLSLEGDPTITLTEAATVELTVLVPTEYEGGHHLLRGTEERPLGELAGGKGLRGALAEVKLADRSALRYRVELGAPLSAAPESARVVMILDVSRSLAQDALHAAQRGAAAYLAHVPDAQVQVITFDRHAQALFPDFVPASDAAEHISVAALSRQNGSDLRAALALAHGAFALAPADAPRRVVVFSDTLLESGVEAADLDLADLGVVHVALPHGGWGGLRRRDDHAWSATVEGAGFTGLAWAAASVSRVTLREMSWGKEVKLVLEPSRRESRLWERLVLGSALAPELSDDEAAG
jgi:hypothetical protein